MGAEGKMIKGVKKYKLPVMRQRSPGDRMNRMVAMWVINPGLYF